MFADDTSGFVQDRLLTNVIDKEHADLKNIDIWYHLTNYQ